MVVLIMITMMIITSITMIIISVMMTDGGGYDDHQHSPLCHEYDDDHHCYIVIGNLQSPFSSFGCAD